MQEWTVDMISLWQNTRTCRVFGRSSSLTSFTSASWKDAVSNSTTAFEWHLENVVQLRQCCSAATRNLYLSSLHNDHVALNMVPNNKISFKMRLADRAHFVDLVKPPEDFFPLFPQNNIFKKTEQGNFRCTFLVHVPSRTQRCTTVILLTEQHTQENTTAR